MTMGFDVNLPLGVEVVVLTCPPSVIPAKAGIQMRCCDRSFTEAMSRSANATHYIDPEFVEALLDPDLRRDDVTK